MDVRDFYDMVVGKFRLVPGVREVLDENIEITARPLTPHEAIGVTDRTDFPIASGKDVMIDAVYKGFHGQAFTDAPSNYRGTLGSILEMDFEHDRQSRGILVAVMNAVLGHLGLCSCTVHCRNDGPGLCAVKMINRLREISTCTGTCPAVLMVGFQPWIIEQLSGVFENVTVLDLNPDNIGQVRYGLEIHDGADRLLRNRLIEHADIILCTGSVVCNGTVVDYLETGKDTWFYGVSTAGIAFLLGLERLCFADTV